MFNKDVLEAILDGAVYFSPYIGGVIAIAVVLINKYPILLKLKQFLGLSSGNGFVTKEDLNVIIDEKKNLKEENNYLKDKIDSLLEKQKTLYIRIELLENTIYTQKQLVEEITDMLKEYDSNTIRNPLSEVSTDFEMTNKITHL